MPQTFLEAYEQITNDLDGRPDTKETWVRHTFTTALLIRAMQEQDARWSDYT